MRKLLRWRISQENVSETIGAWLQRQGQSQAVIDKFWSTVLISALSETVDHASLAAAKKVFVDGFCASRRACELILPRVPLGEIFDRRVPSWLERQGVRIHCGVRVMEIASHGPSGLTVFLNDGTVKNYQAVIVAVPWFEAPSLFSSSPANFPLRLDVLNQIPSAAICAVNLWFDRPITPLPHASLVGRLSQWIFNGTVLMSEHAREERGHGARRLSKQTAQGNRPSEDNLYYYQVVISALHRLVKQNKEELLQAVMSDLEGVFPVVRQAKMLHSRVVTMPQAVFSMQPGVDRYRPTQKTSISNLFFAGDWTATGWPATMEGAVRSGYLAVEGFLKSLGHPQRLLAPDLPRNVLTRGL